MLGLQLVRLKKAFVTVHPLMTILTRVGVNSIPELELKLNSNSNSGIGIGIEIGGIENGIGIEIPGIGIENWNWNWWNWKWNWNWNPGNWNWKLELKLVELKMELELKSRELELKTGIEFFATATTSQILALTDLDEVIIFHVTDSSCKRFVFQVLGTLPPVV